MPIYEYVCKGCGHEFEREQRISEAPVKKCPSCGALKARRQISRTSFVLKGGGWYSDLYGAPKAGKSEAAGAAKDAKPAAAADATPAAAGEATAPAESKADTGGKAPGSGGKGDGKPPGSGGGKPPGSGPKGSKAAAA
jgi:putative FmdB family regulatory protein